MCSSLVEWYVTGTFWATRAALWSRSDLRTQTIKKRLSINASSDEYLDTTDFNLAFRLSKQLFVVLRKFPELYFIPIVQVPVPIKVL